MKLSNGVQVIPGSVGKSPAFPGAFGKTDDRAMTTGRLHSAFRILALILGLATLSIACSDSPADPGRQYLIHLRLFVEGLETSAGPALLSAFRQVNQVRISVTRASNGTVAASEARSVAPGQDAHGINVDVTVQGPGRAFDVVVAALEDDLLLFQSAPIRASVNTNGVSEPDPLNVPLAYNGPGVGATEVKLSHETLVLEVGSSATLTAQVFQGSGVPVDAVPLVWSSSDPTVATVSPSGQLAGITEGYTAVSALVPAGISDSAWAYVVSGELAFVRGGKVFTGSAAGTEATVVTPQSASARMPAWSGDGSKLFYSDEGVVALAGSGALGLPGTWPSLSPDGTKLALERDGRIFFANEDGTNPTPGPRGRTPVWAGEEYYLFAGGGSVLRFRADGSDSSVVAEGAGSCLPAPSATGRLAYLSSSRGQIYVVGIGDGAPIPILPEGRAAVSRPSWSPGESLLTFAGTDGALYVVGSDGIPPPASLPLGLGSDPAWKGAGAIETPPTLQLKSLSPPAPTPGGEVGVLGSGFDFIIPGNNQVWFPTSDGAREGEILEVADTTLRARVPIDVVGGDLRVANRLGEGTLSLSPATVPLMVVAETTAGDPLDGVGLRLLLKGTEVASGTTDERGLAAFDSLASEEHQLMIATPEGFRLQGEGYRDVTPVPGSTIREEVLFLPFLHAVVVEPKSPQVEVGGSVMVQATPLDIRNRPIPDLAGAMWTGVTKDLSVTGEGLAATLTGLYPSERAEAGAFKLSLASLEFTFPATVSSFIQGTVFRAEEGRRSDGPVAVQGETRGSNPTSAAEGFSVELLLPSGDRKAVGTDTAGAYRFDGLFSGSYRVQALPHEDWIPYPEFQDLVLGPEFPSGHANFTAQRGVAETLEITFLSSASRAIVGDEGYLRVIARDRSGNLIEDPQVSWSVDEPSVLTVDANGFARALSVGTAIIVAKSGNASAQMEVTVLASCAGPLTIDDPGDLVAFQASLCGMIVGDLLVESSSATNLDGMEDLLRVAGDVAILENADLQDISGLRGLEEVGGTLVISGNPVLRAPPPPGSPSERAPYLFGESLAPPAAASGTDPLPVPQAFNLRRVKGDLIIELDPLLEELDWLGLLESVNGRFAVSNMATLADMSGLVGLQLAGGVDILYNPSLDSPSGFPALTRVVDGIILYEAGTRLGFQALETSSGGIYIVGEGGGSTSQGARVDPGMLKEVSFPALACVDGFLVLNGNEELTSASFPTLQTLGSCGGVGEEEQAEVDESRWAAPSSTSLPSLRIILERLAAFRAEVSERALSLREIRRIPGEGAAFTRQLDPDGWFDALAVEQSRPRVRAAEEAENPDDAGLALADNPLLVDLDLTSLRRVEGPVQLYWDNHALSTVSLDALEIVFRNLELWDTDLTTAAFPSLAEVGGDLVLVGNRRLESFTFPVLRAIWGNSSANASPTDGESHSFVSLNRPELSSPGGIGWLCIYENELLHTWSIPALTNLGVVDVFANPSLVHLPDMPELPPWISISVEKNQGLTALDGFGKLTEAYWVYLSNNSLTSLAGLQNLEVLGHRLEIYDEDALTSATFPSLAAVDALYVAKNDSLASFSAPALGKIGGSAEGSGMLAFGWNPRLTDLSFPALATLDGSMNLIENQSLSRLNGFDRATFTSDLVNLSIEKNATLIDLSGLRGLGRAVGTDPIIKGDLTITGNTILTDSAARQFLADLENKFPGSAVAGKVTISGNN